MYLQFINYKIQYPLVVYKTKILSKSEIEGDLVHPMKGMYKKNNGTANIVLNSKLLKSFPPRLGKKTVISIHTTPVQQHTSS